jgi:hypothetical protein
MAAVGMAVGAGAVDGDPAGVEAGRQAGELGGARAGDGLVGDGAAPGAGVGPDRALLWRQDFTAVDALFDVRSPARGVHAGFWSIGSVLVTESSTARSAPEGCCSHRAAATRRFAQLAQRYLEPLSTH